jgi:ABC-type multidrug transport system fused ATPase/permease subunit
MMASVLTDGLNIGWVEGRGPGAGMWPFWLSLGMALACVATMIRWFRGATPESRSTEDYIASETLFLIGVSVAALFTLLVLMATIGTYFALMLFMLFYVRILGKHSWRVTLSLVFGTPIFVYLLFEVALTKYLPKGLPVFEEMFLFIDDYRYMLLS